jgi:hypothetical protein
VREAITEKMLLGNLFATGHGARIGKKSKPHGSKAHAEFFDFPCVFLIRVDFFCKPYFQSGRLGYFAMIIFFVST